MLQQPYFPLKHMFNTYSFYFYTTWKDILAFHIQLVVLLNKQFDSNCKGIKHNSIECKQVIVKHNI